MSRFIEAIGMGGGLLFTFVLLIVLTGLAIISFPEKLMSFSYVVPIMFLFIAIGAFLLLLEHYAYTLHNLKPQLAVAALGLPEGSVRAFLTIGLIALVAVFGTFIYFEAGKSAYTLVREGVPVGTADELTELKTSVGDRFIVIPRYAKGALVAADVVAATPDTGRSDIAKQLLTMVVTVLTTVIGFYFGTRSTETAPPDSARNDPARQVLALTEDLRARRDKLEAALGQARQVAADLKATGGDPQGRAEQRLREVDESAKKAVAELEEARKTVTDAPGNAAVATAALEKATKASTDLDTAETTLQAFISRRDPSAL